MVYVSTGKPQVNVPDLTNDTQAQAQAALVAVGLNPSFTDQPVSQPSQDGIVQSQNPVAGTSVTPGSTVSVVIGSYNSSSTTSTTGRVSRPVRPTRSWLSMVEVVTKGPGLANRSGDVIRAGAG